MLLISREKIAAVRFILSTAIRGRKRRFLAILAFGALASVMGGLGIGIMVPLAAIALDRQADGSADAVTRVVMEWLNVIHIRPSLSVLVTLLVVLFAAKAVVQFLSRFLLARLGAQYEERMRGEMLAGTLAMEWPALSREKIGHLERVIIDDTTRAGEVFRRTVTFFLLVLSLAAYTAVAMGIDPRITLVTAVIGFLLFSALRPIYRRSRRAAQAVIDEEKSIAHLVGGILQNGKTVKAFSIGDQLMEGGSSAFRRLRAAKTRLAFFQYGLGPLFEPIAAIFIAGVFVFSGKSGHDIIAFGAVIYLIQKLFQFMQSAQENLQLVNESLPSAQALARYRAWYRDHRERSGGSLCEDVREGIALEDVSFSYESGRLALANLSVNIPKGAFVGVVGPSGSGKTTFVDILLGLLKPSGFVRIDGVDLWSLSLPSWRKLVGYVPQDIVLFDGTITENVCFFDDTCTPAKVRRAAELAGIHEFIHTLPEGYETVLGERGLGLSGGERQRIALARALYRNPRLLILDEATSALDAEAERTIRSTVESLRGSMTIIWISHKEQNVTAADLVLRLQNGALSPQ